MRVAVVMNMFYTGLGIARSLGQQNVRVIGLSAHRRSYGNATRYAEIRRAPDSRCQPELLLRYLLRLADELPDCGVIFPTRDDDVIFLDRFRRELEGRFSLILPNSAALAYCVDKWHTFEIAQQAGIQSPRTWAIRNRADLERARLETSYPCVLKPVSAYQWRQEDNWAAVGRRKAIPLSSAAELVTEYAKVEPIGDALLQEIVPGPDDHLYVAACHIDQNGRLAAAFTARKLLQVPNGFGTGCVVEVVDRPDLLMAAERLLHAMGFTGIAEVEFKLDANTGNYKLIEVNPRPWDQHRLGAAAGADVIVSAYRDACGLSSLVVRTGGESRKWIADDVFCLALLGSLAGRGASLRKLLRVARGRRVYAIGSWRDPLPFLALVVLQLAPELIGLCGGLAGAFWRRVTRRARPRAQEAAS
jgi:D-aspartate ligase